MRKFQIVLSLHPVECAYSVNDLILDDERELKDLRSKLHLNCANAVWGEGSQATYFELLFINFWNDGGGLKTVKFLA